MLAVGKELLIGRTVNTNAYWIGKRLALLGSILQRVVTVDDDLEEIASALRECLARSPDFIIVVGGLGPTPDDMTLRGVAEGMGRGIQPSAEALEMMRGHYAKRGMRGVTMTRARRKMALLPEGSDPVRNEFGTAPGVRMIEGRTVIYCLPGVPREMRGIFRRSVEPEIRRRIGRLYRKAVTLKVEGMLESVMAPLIGRELRRYRGAYIKSHPRGVKEGVSRLELDVAAVSKRRSEADGIVAGVVREMTAAIRAAGATVVPEPGARRD